MTRALDTHGQPVTRVELSPGVRLLVSEAPAGPVYELVHTRQGFRQTLTGEEYSIFDRLQKGVPLEEVSQVSAHAQRLCARLIGAGLLQPQSQLPSFLPDDRPRLRVGITFQKTQKPGIVSATAPGGVSREMRDLEAALARAFDGNRSVLDVVEAARLRGIPATLQTMVTFLKELRSMGLLENLSVLQDEEIQIAVGGAPDEPPNVAPVRWNTGEIAASVEVPPGRPAPPEPLSDPRLEALQSLTLDKDPSPSPSRLPWILLVAVLAAAAVGLYLVQEKHMMLPLPGLTSASAPQTPATPAAGLSPVRIATVDFTPAESESVRAAGYVAARDPIVVGVSVGGRVTSVLVDDGAAVKKGQLLVQIDDSQILAEVGLAKAKWRDAWRSLSRAQTLFENHATTELELDRARGQAEIARAELTLQQARLEQTRVRSPINNGTVLDVIVRPGEVLAPTGRESAAVVKMADLTRLVAELDVNEGDIFKLRSVDSVEIVPEASAATHYNGTIREIAQEADRARGTVLVTVDLLVPDRSLRPGNSVKATFRTRPDRRMLIPRAALVQGNRVMTVSNGVASVRPVATRPAGPDSVEVTSGLSSGERVVVSGTDSVRDGQHVE